MRLALMIAAAGATGRAGTSPQALLRNGLKQLGASAELGKLTDIARDELLGAAKAAAVTAASSRINSLSDRLQESKDGKQSSGGAEHHGEDETEQDREGEEAKPAHDEDTESAQTEDAESAEDEDAGSAEEDTGSTEDEDTGSAEDGETRRPARRRATGRSSGDEEESERPVRRRATSRRESGSSESAESGRRTRSTSRRAPVRRAGR
ncbi:hypothetical protein [Amycolatopsis acididurans]|nr:hypothetical protein [Amycolatopsis acididurans]